MNVVRHVGIVVADLDRMTEFYSKVFSLREVARANECGPYIDALVGLCDVQLGWVKLEDGHGVIVELLQYYSHPSSAETIHPARMGCSHVAFTVDSIDGIADKICAAGGGIGAIQENAQHTVRVAYARDPEGGIMELVEEIF